LITQILARITLANNILFFQILRSAVRAIPDTVLTSDAHIFIMLHSPVFRHMHGPCGTAFHALGFGAMIACAGIMIESWFWKVSCLKISHRAEQDAHIQVIPILAGHLAGTATGA
jgi:hypothetical protein